MAETRIISSGKPDPDPTLLTTENLRREIANLKELIETATGDLHLLIESKLNALSAVTDERFSSIAIQFAERDKRTEQLSLADKTAIAAALQAQKEAAGATNESNSVALAKMENNFTKLIDQGQTLLQSVAKNMDDKINDLKSRFDTGEGKSKGVGDVWGWIFGAAALLIAAATVFVHGR
jgi:hypothetical protein